MSLAKIQWNNDRYELKIDNTLKAYSKGKHEIGLEQMVKLAETKGYTVHVEHLEKMLEKLEGERGKNSEQA